MTYYLYLYLIGRYFIGSDEKDFLYVHRYLYTTQVGITDR